MPQRQTIGLAGTELQLGMGQATMGQATMGQATTAWRCGRTSVASCGPPLSCSPRRPCHRAHSEALKASPQNVQRLSCIRSPTPLAPLHAQA